MKTLKRIIKANCGLSVLILVLIIRFLFALAPSIHESLYFKIIFPGIRGIQSWFNPLWVVPGYSILLLIIAILISYYLIKRKSWNQFFRKLINLFSWVLSFFMICFGFQYLGQDLSDRMKLPPPPDSVDLYDLYFQAMENALSSRSKIKGIDKVPDITAFYFTPNKDSIHSDVNKILATYGYKAGIYPVVVQEIPFGILRKLSISGIYNPFTGECNVDGKLPVLIKTNVIAHEMAHSSGITSEGEANFIAWLALNQSSDPYLNYASDYALWRQVAKHINKKLNSEELNQISTLIPDDLLKDRTAIIAILRKDAPIYPELTEKFNDTYLKVQGVDAGVEDYDKFLSIYLSWAKSNPKQ